jgi:hypothetical protein
MLWRKDDPWNLKQLFFLIVVPFLILNFTESTVGDCRYAVGMIATLCWALAERQRLSSHQRPAAVPTQTIFATPISGQLRRAG